jgi:hypothetical protein
MFETSIAEISAQVERIDPVEYARTRNFTNGAVTRLSPYISRSLISPKYVLDAVRRRGYKFFQIQKFIQELRQLSLIYARIRIRVAVRINSMMKNAVRQRLFCYLIFNF